MSNVGPEHARDQIESFVEGKPKKTYPSLMEFAGELKWLSERMMKVRRDIADLFEAGSEFLRRNPLKKESLGGILKHIRLIADDAHEIELMTDTQQKPPSMRTLVESMLSIKMFMDGLETGDYSFEAHGKKFVSSGVAIPQPPPKKNATDREKFFMWLREAGLGHTIVQDVAFRELQSELTRRLEARKNGDPYPWPEWINVYVGPRITIREATGK